jgi:hypothetical protein
MEDGRGSVERPSVAYRKTVRCLWCGSAMGFRPRQSLQEQRDGVNSVGLGDRRGCDEGEELLESEQWLAL